jgi:[ribosomal protein S18]-alanine N-acetyltransferase
MMGDAGGVGDISEAGGMGDMGDLSVRVREMVVADLDAVMRIERSSFTMPWTLDTFRGLLRRTDAELFVAEVAGGPVVAYAVVWMVVDQAELGDIAVAEAWRRLGIARRLIDTVLERLARRGVREVFLEVRPSNMAARRLYERYGFAEVGRRKNYYSRPREDALVLRRDVGPGEEHPVG